MQKKPEWKVRWRVLCRQTKHEGVYETKEGGYLIRARVKDPTRPDKLIPRLRILPPGISAADAVEQRLRLKREAREQAGVAPSVSARRPVFYEFATSVYEWRVKQGKIASPASKRSWVSTLKRLFEAPFAEQYVDAIRGTDIKAWLATIPIGRGPGEYSPRTLNAWWLNVLRVIFDAAVTDLGLAADPMRGIEPFSTDLYRTYTKEEPNALEAEDVAGWLALVRQHYPHHHALITLGFTAGRRPSALRPLRRKGLAADIDWDKGTLLFRRSHVRGMRGPEIVEKTKTGKDQELYLSKPLLDMLADHIDRLEGAQKESDLLFPGPKGEPWAENTLRWIFCKTCELYELRSDPERALALCRAGQVRVFAVARALDLSERETEARAAEADPQAADRPAPPPITPRAMRRSMYGLADAAEIEDQEAREVADHASKQMADRYREGQRLPREVARQKQSLAKIYDLATARKERTGGQTGGQTASGDDDKDNISRRCCGD